MKKYKILQGDNKDTLKTLADNSVDAIVTDPPYGIDFLGKEWDANTGALETYQECLRVLKPGGYILAFSAARTYHYLAVTLEQAGFEIRDQLMWLYASGFPKAQDIGKAIDKRAGNKDATVMVAPTYGTNGEKIVNNSAKGQLRCPVCKKTSEQRYHCGKGDECGMVYKPQSPEAKQWEGWKTALKPAHEPICMARKPMKGSTIDNVLTHGVGALNIDATRIEWAEGKAIQHGKIGTKATFNDSLAEAKGVERNKFNKDEEEWKGNEAGRFPSNVIGEVSEEYQKYFYCPKVSRKERHCGFEQKDIPTSSGGMYDNHGTGKMYNIGTDMTTKKGILTNPEMVKEMGGYYLDENGERSDQEGGNKLWLPQTGPMYTHGLKEEYRKWCKKNNKPTGNVGNNHPTVKPVDLMRYLIKLVTPPNGKVLDPFCGSGSTGMAAVELGFEFIGCELDPAYVDIAKTRIEAWNNTEYDNNFNELFEEL